MTDERRAGWLMVEGGVAPSAAPYGSRLAAVGRALPEAHLSTSELMATTRHRTGIDLQRLTGVEDRRIATGRDDSLSLATRAARDCLDRGGYQASDLQAVVSCSITKYRDGLVQWLEPPTAAAVAAELGAESAVAFDISNACAGMLTGVLVMSNWVRQGLIERGLVVSGEYISQLGENAARHIRNIMSRELASLTLGDAGAAILVERAPADHPGIALAGFTTVADHSRLCLAYPASHEPGARMFTRSQALQKAAIKDTPFLLAEALDAAGLGIADINLVIPHQTSVRAIRKGMAHVTEVLGGAPQQPAVVTVDHFGNTASTTHTVALIEELHAGHVHPGDHIALVALASGLVIGVVIFSADEELVKAHEHDA